jgi:nuclear pore complex protein Nup133
LQPIYANNKFQARSQLLVRELFRENDKLDETVVALSAELCDEIPHSDPRWAQSNNYSHYTNETITASVIVMNQLEEKLRTHRFLIGFLKVSNLWERLMSLYVNGSRMSSKLILCEHAEKLMAALTLRKIHNDYSTILEAAIKIVLHQRNAILQPRLTPMDIFYRETTKIDDLIWALIEYETDQINSVFTNSKDVLKFLLSISNILITLFQEICHYRQSQGALYESAAILKCEYIPWSSTAGTNGVRTSLLKHFDYLVNFGIESTNTTFVIEEDIQLKGAICQKIVELSDIILDGFICQLKSIEPNSERHQIVERSFESCRSKCIQPLMKVRQFDRAAALAEKYEDFDILIKLCEELNNPERLQRYIVDFANKGFAEYLFKWYLKEGKQGKMLATASNTQMLSNFLKSHEQLNWLHQIHLGLFEAASLTLKKLAFNEQSFLGRKKTLLSLSKLSAIAAGETSLNELDSQLELILYQENLSPDLLVKFNLDYDTMKVLSPQKLIEIYISEKNANSNALDFKKALDLTEFIEDVDSNEKLKIVLNIWCTAINRDRFALT